MSSLPSSETAESGQALVEFALVLPVLLLVLLAMLDMGKAFNYWQDATHISAEGARYAAVNRKPLPASATSLQQQLRDQTYTQELHSGGSASLPDGAQVCISFPAGTSNPGDPVEVRMAFTYHWLSFLGDALGTSTTITGKSTMRLEAVPTNFAAACG